ncbi:hypothetical protein Taro_026060 [Colocasia esculenta]|uniref:Protein kinase domain-containing protein n=1 Tax=Colocasia esculenta TaxID=4460 RepID=A0A843VAF1_COLES|nr:hypothetical protein [Colocasia esculenta]
MVRIFLRKIQNGRSGRYSEPWYCGGLYLLSLDLSLNAFDGDIPKSLENLAVLLYLNLSFNKLEGPVPEGGNLEFLEPSSLQGNLGLCGAKTHRSCEDYSLLTPRYCSKKRAASGHPKTEMAALWFVLLTLLHTAMPATPDNVQLEALMAFKDSITGDPQDALAGWTSSAHHCSWPGISCDPSDNSVLSIDLPSRGLNGTISPFLGNISTLRHLHLSSNSFRGTLPSQLGNLKKVWSLDLGRNLLRGAIPISICNCTSLMYLSLSFNSLSGSLPPCWGSLYKLQVLDVKYNTFHGPLPNDLLINCTGLVNLDLGNNKLSGILNPRIGKLTKLEILHLNDNLFSGQIPPDIGNLAHLQELHLERNSIEGVIPVQIFELRQLNVLHLHQNRLTGSIPDAISRLHMLYDINLNNNQLNSSLPQGIKDLENLLFLDVSANMLSGKLPVNIFSKLHLLERLDLSRNKLAGELALGEGLLQRLTYLDLSLNAFDGAIPKSLENLAVLSYLNLSFNKFQGPVPECGIFEHLDPSSLQGNLGLYGAKTHGSCESGKPKLFPKKARLSKKTLLLVALSSSLGLLLVLVTAAIITKRCRTRRSSREECKRDIETEIAPVLGLKRFAEKDLEFATNFFSEANVIGKSNLSTVYTGRLADGGKRIAVKRLNLHQFPSETNKCFFMELRTLGILKHRNLVKVAGYAWEPDRLKALVLEFMENGSLENVIHDDVVVLDRSRWKEVSERLRVCISVANGLVYLHTGYDFPIVHCDLKPSNILFDQEWEAHVSDFGAARMLNIHSPSGSSIMSTSFALLGTIGYMAPELAYLTKVTTKVDVFSFGVVLMEFLTGRRPTEVEGKDGHPPSLPELVAEALAGGVGKVLPVLDRDMELTSSRDVQVAVRLLDLAGTCTQAQVAARPDMSNVLSSLLKLREEYRQVTT